MTTTCIDLDLEQHSDVNARQMLIREVRRGLLQRPRSLPPWMFYDARGSDLFEQITQTPEYYPTRTEREILVNYSDAIIAAACPVNTNAIRLVELGAGTARKTTILLEAAAKQLRQVTFAPVDVSSDALDIACHTIATLLPEISVSPIVANYVTDPPKLDSFEGTTLSLYIGSSIGNFSPEEARTILRNLRRQLQPGDALLLGVDMVKDQPTLLAAYNDAAGITAQFNLNLLHRLNQELDANFDLANFSHRAIWNAAKSRIEMHLQSTRDQRVYIAAANLDLHFARDERIHTENSHKFTDEKLHALLADADFQLEQTWTDQRGWFSVILARVR